VIVHDAFDASEALAAIDAGATHVSLVPLMLSRMLEVRGSSPWPSSLRCILLGGSGAPRALIDTCLRLGLPIAPTYGLTEAASQLTTLLPCETAAKPGSSGLPLATTQVRVANAHGELPAGEIGEIEIRGATVFAGYLRDRTSARSNADWFRTGDLGYLDADGYLFVVDRRDDLIISGGENIYPTEIEGVLRRHPSVVDAGVVGLASEEWGTRPAAAVIWRGDPSLAEPSLRGFLRDHLAAYKIPDRVFVVTSLPRSTSGKLLRRNLRTQLEGCELE
jgi:o-succinylbenzoate---CoA ligase